MPSKWAYAIAREQCRDIETMAKNLDAAREQGQKESQVEIDALRAQIDDLILPILREAEADREGKA